MQKFIPTCHGSQYRYSELTFDEGVPSLTRPSRLLIQPVPNGEHFGIDGVGLGLARLRSVGHETPYLSPPVDFRCHRPAGITLPQRSQLKLLRRDKVLLPPIEINLGWICISAYRVLYDNSTCSAHVIVSLVYHES